MAENAHAYRLVGIEVEDGEKKNGDERAEVVEDGEAKEIGVAGDGVEESFTFMVGTYAIRPFLRKLDDFAGELEERRLVEAKKRCDESLSQLQGRGVMLSVMKERMKEAQTRMKELRKSLRTRFNAFGKGMKKGKPELCFGEIESGEDLPRGNAPIVSKNAMKEGLLWYYGDVGVMVFRARQEAERIKGDEKAEDTRGQVCAASKFV